MQYGKKYKSKPRRYRKYTKKTLAKPMVKAVKAIVRKQMKTVVETKHSDYAWEPFAVNSLYHNTWLIVDADGVAVSQGVGDNDAYNPGNRIGDSVYARKIWRRLQLFQSYSYPNLTYRIVIIKHKQGMTIPVDITQNSQTTNKIIAPINRELFPLEDVVYDRVFQSTQGGGTVGNGEVKVFWNHNQIINKKITYNDSTQYARGFTYSTLVCVYDNMSTSLLAQVARLAYYRRFYFDDA